MKIDPNAPAMPCICQPDANGHMTGAQIGSTTFWEAGLTIRAHFAVEAMKALIPTVSGEGSMREKCEAVAAASLVMADALIAELNK